MAIEMLSALAAYIPRDRVEHIIHGRRLDEDGVAMIADISGFTPLTEALTHGLSADHGAEELTRALDSVFTPLIEQVHRYRGSVIKFGGDALIVWFGREKRVRITAVIRRALTAAQQMQKTMTRYGHIPTPIGTVTLQMKIGLTYGSVKRFNLGLSDIGFEDVLAGATLDRMADNEHQAEPGDIMVDRHTLSHLPTAVTISEWRGEAAVVERVLRPSKPKPWPPLVWQQAEEAALTKQLAAYVPNAIVETLQIDQSQVAELKPVLSLFVQFHGLDYDADPDILEKLQTYFGSAQQVVARYNGRLNRLITGDKGSLLHIIFGAPRSVEEQEERAVRCALDLQAECGALSFITMQRIGITSGRVFAGPVGSPLRHDYTTMGDAINLSARLMQNAADDQILLDTAVREQLSPAIDVTDLGTIKVKGKSDPIHVYAADAFHQLEHAAHQVERPFGREHELAVIANQLSGISDRLPAKGSIVTIIGEVGQGKTLLLDNARYETEKMWETDPNGGVWASGISLAYGNTFTGYLFIDLLRDLINVPSGATPQQTSQRLREFCEDLFGHGRVESTYPYLAKFMNLPLPDALAARLEGLAGESLRWQIFELVPDLLRTLCRHFPLVLALDDLQWADPTSLQLLERLAPLTTEIPLLLLLALRPEEETRAWEWVHSWDTAVLPHTTLTLNPFNDEAAASLIHYHLPNLPDHILTYLVQKGGGNPLFLVELARTLQLTQTTDLAAVELDAIDLPNSVQGLLLAQLDRLAVETRHTLQLASVIGKTFLDQVLANISTAEQQVTDLLSELTSRDYVRPDKADLGEAHSFRHSLIQEGAYSTLLHERRRTYHRQVAEAFEHLFPAAIVEQAAFLAYHYEHAEDLDNAIFYLNQTADQARLLYAHEEAEQLYQRILTLLQQLPDTAVNQERQAKIYLKLAQVQINSLNYDAAQHYYDFAFDLFEQVELQEVKRQTATETTELPVFRWGVREEFTRNLDPAKVETSYALQLVINLFEGLVELDHDWNIIPLMARRWQVLDDGRRYRFELRQDWRWSDGVPVTAHDYVFAWRRNLHPETNASMAHQLYAIQGAEAYHQGTHTDPTAVGIRALDDWTLEIELDTAVNYFFYLLAYPVTLPQPAHKVEQAPETWGDIDKIICNGPFLPENVAAEWRLVPNPEYRSLLTENRIQVALRFSEPNWEHYHDGNVDWCRVDDRADLPTLYPESSFLVQGYVTFFLGFACQTPPFDNPQVRQAFVQAINRQELVQTVWGGVQKAATGGFVPPGMPGHSPEISLPFDAQQAMVNLERAGFSSGQDLPEITVLALPGFGQTPDFLKSAWETYLDVNVNVLDDISSEDFFSYFSQGSGQVALMGWFAAFPDPDDLLRGLFQSDSPNNVLRWQSVLFDELLNSAQEAVSFQERFDYYHRADQLLVKEDTAVAPLYYLQAYGLLRPPFHFGNSGKIIRDGNIKFKNIRVG